MSDNKKANMLTLEPRESIVFEGPFNRTQCKSLIIGNPSKTQSVAFKLKTTSLRMFSVRPNIGTVAPDSKATVDIFMQPIIQDAGQKEIKFLVQAALVSDSYIDMQEFWKEQNPADIWQAKIKCALVQRKPSEEELRQAGGATGASTTFDPKPGDATTTLYPKPDGATSTLDSNPEDEIDFDALEISEPEAQLYKQISILEDERIVLKEEISMLQDRTIVNYAKPLDMEFFIVASCVLTILAAIVGAYCGKLYL